MDQPWKNFEVFLTCYNTLPTHIQKKKNTWSQVSASLKSLLSIKNLELWTDVPASFFQWKMIKQQMQVSIAGDARVFCMLCNQEILKT